MRRILQRGDESPLSYFLDMDFEKIKNKIEEWLQPWLEEKDLFLVDIKFPAGRKIEVYVDSDEGIHIDECAAISRFLENKLDGSGLVPDNYILEVSSPGMTNPLKLPRQYKRRVGRVLEIVKSNGEQLAGKLISVSDNEIILAEYKEEAKKKGFAPKKKHADEQAAKEFVLRFGDIKRAVLKLDW